MKKAISLLLVLVMCLSMCACGGDADTDSTGSTAAATEEENGGLELCQEWKAVSNGSTIRFDEEGKFYINGGTYDYQYDAENSEINVDVYGVQVKLPVTLVDGVYRIDVEGTEFVPAAEYERLHAEYAQTMMVVTGFDGTPALNAALVEEHIDRVELTVENWREYVKIYTYDVEVVTKDAFGEVTDTQQYTVYRLGYGTERYYYLDATIELKHKETGETTIYGNSGKSFFVDETMDLEDYECTRIKGYVYFIDYPQDVMDQVLDRSDRWSATYYNAEIKFTSSSAEGTWRVDCEAMVIENGSGQWSNYFE